MSSNLISLFGTLGAWLRGIVSHLIALVLAPLLDSVRMQFYPPPAPPPDPMVMAIFHFSEKIKTLGEQIELLRGVLEAREEPGIYELAIRAARRRRNQ